MDRGREAASVGGPWYAGGVGSVESAAGSVSRRGGHPERTDPLHPPPPIYPQKMRMVFFQATPEQRKQSHTPHIQNPLGLCYRSG